MNSIATVTYQLIYAFIIEYFVHRPDCVGFKGEGSLGLGDSEPSFTPDDVDDDVVVVVVVDDEEVVVGLGCILKMINIDEVKVLGFLRYFLRYFL